MAIVSPLRAFLQATPALLLRNGDDDARGGDGRDDGGGDDGRDPCQARQRWHS